MFLWGPDSGCFPLFVLQSCIFLPEAICGCRAVQMTASLVYFCLSAPRHSRGFSFNRTEFTTKFLCYKTLLELYTLYTFILIFYSVISPQSRFAQLQLRKPILLL